MHNKLCYKFAVADYDGTCTYEYVFLCNSHFLNNKNELYHVIFNLVFPPLSKVKN